MSRSTEQVARRYVTNSTDDTRLVRETLTDGSHVYNVEVDVDGGCITVECNGYNSACTAFSVLSDASCIFYRGGEVR